ncbi:MAG: hypothetical protein IJG33_02845 [Selenomonadaceae bacterium]|nr:hypothetical protein [Selenomonadaceae bacterium]
MKKIFLLAMMICLALTGTALAARDYQSVGVVIIGGVEFKTDDYFDAIKDTLKPKSGAKIIVGNDMQTRYKKYWLNRGFIGEQPPQKEDFTSFAASNGFSKVVYVVISDVSDDQRNSGDHRQRNRISVQVDAYLSTPTQVVDVFAYSDDQKSKGSALRARRGAFKKCMSEIAKSLNRHI